MQIIFKKIPPAKKNSKRVFVNKGRPIVLPSERHQDWEEEQMWILKKFPKGKFDRCEMLVGFFPSSKRRFDLSNSFESIADLLVKAKIIKDDNAFLLSKVTLALMEVVDKGQERVEILIIERL